MIIPSFYIEIGVFYLRNGESYIYEEENAGAVKRKDIIYHVNSYFLE